MSDSNVFDSNRTRVSEDREDRGDVAIVGMACTFAQASDLSTYWSNVLNKVVAVGDVPTERWNSQPHLDSDPNWVGHLDCAKGAFLNGTFGFDPVRLRVPPSAVRGADPDQFLVLRCAYEALADANCLDADLLGERIEVIVGRAAADGPGTRALWQRTEGVPRIMEVLASVSPDLTREELTKIEEEMLAGLPPFSAETVPGVVPNVVAGRVANRFDFMNANFVVDAACATGLVVAELAVRNLLAGTADMSIVGAVHVHLDPSLMAVFRSIGAISSDGVCRPLDRNSDGTIMGEGVGMLVLKRAEDAIRDGNRIYALLKGIGSSSDGKSTALLSPSPKGEMLALERAYARSGVPRDAVDLIELHGTGTAAGDRTELEVVNGFFGPSGRAEPIAIGSVKSMIGHTLVAAGVASLIKTALALYHRTLPPTANCERPHGLAQGPQSALYVNSETRPWMRPQGGGPRRAGVSAFGFGGVNAHAVLEEYEDVDESSLRSLYRRWPSELVVLEADTRDELVARMEKLVEDLNDAVQVDLATVACTLAAALAGSPRRHRLALVVQDARDLVGKLQRALGRLRELDEPLIEDRSGIHYHGNLRKEARIALMFPGEGSPYVDAMRDLAVVFPHVRIALERFDALAAGTGAEPLSPYIFPPPRFGDGERREAEEALRHPHRSAPIVRATGLAMLELTKALGIGPDMVCGHSAGEWVSMVAGGILDPTAIPSLHGELGMSLGVLSEIPRVGLFAVGMSSADVAELERKSGCSLTIVNDNCPHQVVVAVSPGEESALVAHCRERRLVAERLPFDSPFHTGHYAVLVEALGAALSTVGVCPPRVRTYSCSVASTFPNDRDAIIELASASLSRPVLFGETINRMYADGARIFVEAGPGNVLSGFVSDTLADKPHHVVSLDRPRSNGIVGLLHALAKLAALGVPMNLKLLYDVRGLPPETDWDEALGRRRASGRGIDISLVSPRLAVPGPRIERQKSPVTPVSADPELAGRASGREPTQPAMDAYFDTMEAFISSQEEVMAAYLDRSDDPQGRSPGNDAP